MNKYSKVILRGESPLQNPREIFKDRLTVTADAIAYEYHPLFKTERNPMRKWEYSTDSPVFKVQYERFCEKVPAILDQEDKEFDHEQPMTEFEVHLTDGSSCKEKFYLKPTVFEEAFAILRTMVPETEYIPAILITEED